MSPGPRPTLREVTRSTDRVIAPAHDLLRRSFHKAELVGRSEWRESLREREANLWSDIRWHLVVAELGGRVIGAASGTYLGNVNTGVIGYLAVASSARGLGIGPGLRGRLRSLFQADARVIRREPLTAVIGEVRRDNPWLKTLVRRERVIALDFAYYQPQLHENDHPVPLVLYYESLDRRRRRLSADLLRRLLYTTWRRVYRIARPMADREFKRMVKALANRRSIGGLTPADLPDLVTSGSR